MILVVFLGVSLISRAETCAGPPPLEARLHDHAKADAFVELGNWFSENHKPDCAIQTFQSGLKQEPGSARLYYLLGSSLYTSGRAQEAVAPLQHSIQLHSGDAKAHLALGAALAALGRQKEALPEWEAALKIDPVSSKALDGFAKALIATGDYETAISRLRTGQRDENLTLDLGIAYKNAGQVESAEQVFTEGLKAYPNSNALTGSLVSLYINDSQFETASKVAAELAHRKPRDIEAQRIYMHALAIAGNNDEAVPLARTLLALAPHDSDILQMNGFFERKAGDFPAARKHIEEAVALKPNDPNNRANLGSLLVQLQDAAGAKVQLKKAVELGATEPEVRFELAKVLRMLGESEEAQKQLQIYQQQLKERSDRYEAMLKAAEAAQAAKAGDSRKAADLYREACVTEPNDASLAYRLALVLSDLGDVQGERSALEQAVKADPGFVLAQYQLGYLDFQAGDDPAAERRFRMTVEALPSNVQAWCSLASTLARQSRFQEAQDAVNSALKLEPNNAIALKLNQMLAAAISQH